MTKLSIDQLLKYSLDSGASDLHLSVGSIPRIRIHGEMHKLQLPPLDEENMQGVLNDVMSKNQERIFKENLEIDFSTALEGHGRFRVNFFHQMDGLGGVFRTIPTEILSVDELGLSPFLNQLAMKNRGLVLLTGPTGSGKSTTLAAMMDYLNDHRQCHIITIEDGVKKGGFGSAILEFIAKHHYKNSIKILLIISGILYGTDFDKLFKVATLENSYQNKVEFAIARTVDASLFDVQVNVVLENNTEYAEYLTIQSENDFDSIEDEPAKVEDTPRQFSPGLLPGLPSIPTSAVDEKGLAVDTKKEVDEKSEFKGIPSEFVIDRIEVMVRLDESVSSPNTKQEITTIIRSVIPDIENCFDCVDFEVKEFLSQSLSNQINRFSEDQGLLKEELSNQFKSTSDSQNSFAEILNNKFAEIELTNENNKLDLEDRLNELSNSRAQEIIELQLSLEESLEQIATDVRVKLEDDMTLRDRKSHINDSTMWSEYVQRANDYQKQQNDLMKKMTDKRLETEQRYANDILKFAEEQLERVMSKDDSEIYNPAYNRADLGMQKIGTKGIVEFLPWIFAGLSFLLLLISLFKKPKPIYLKPKYSSEPKEPGPIMVEKQQFEEDNDVIRTEVKRIRQAAVAESIREKEGAGGIISDWLDDENDTTTLKEDDNSDNESDDKNAKGKDKKKKK